MDALLIVGGITMVLIGWIWLVADARSLPIERMLLAVFLPFITLFARGRGYALLPRLLLLLGLGLVAAGAFLLYHQQPQRFELLLSGQWAAPANRSGTVEGTLVNQPFYPDRVLWRGSELVFEEGEDGRVRRSLAIRFANAPEMLQNTSMERLPGDEGSWPLLVMQWYSGALSAPGLRRVADDYTLSLDFAPQTDGRVRVRIHLHLPTVHGTRLTGEAWLDSAPEWLSALDAARRAAPTRPAATPRVEPPAPPPAPVSEWQTVSLLALLDEPQLALNKQVRLTTWTNRVYEGRVTSITPERRIVIAQPRGANQVDFHFHPLDVRSLEVFHQSPR